MSRPVVDSYSDSDKDPAAAPDSKQRLKMLASGLAGGIALATCIVVAAHNNQYEATKFDRPTSETKDPFQAPICSTPDYSRSLASCIDVSTAGSFMIAYGGVLDTLVAYDSGFSFNRQYSGNTGFTVKRAINSSGTYTDDINRSAITAAGTVHTSLRINRTQSDYARGVYRQTHLPEPGHPHFSDKQVTISNDGLTMTSLIDADGNMQTTADQTKQTWRMYRPSLNNRPLARAGSALDGYVVEGSLKDGQQVLQDLGDFAQQALKHTEFIDATSNLSA